VTVSAEAVARLLALVEGDDAEVRRQLAQGLGDQRPLGGRHWSEFSTGGLVAFLLLSLEAVADAGRLAARSLKKGPDELGAAVAENVRAHYYRAAVKAIYRKRPDMTRAILAELWQILGGAIDLAAEAGMLAMIDFAASIPEARDTPIADVQGRPTVIHFCAWGERFIGLAGRTVLPTLLASGNVPGLRASGTPIVLIHSRDEDIPGFRRLPVVQALEREGRVVFSPIPGHLMASPTERLVSSWGRMLIAVLQYDALMAARRLGADFVPLGADMLVSGACLSAAKVHLLGGKEAVVTVPLRSVAGPLLERLEAGGFHRGAALDVPADRLYRASLETLHPFIRDSFMRREPTRIPVDPVQFFFPVAGGFVGRCFHLLPLMVSTARLPRDIGCDFWTLDARLLSDVLAGLDRSSACHVHTPVSGGDMNCLSLDEEAGVAAFGSEELSPVGAAQAVHACINRYEDLEHFIWAGRQRFIYPLPPDLDLAVPQDCRDEMEVEGEIVRWLQEHRRALFDELYGYRSAPGPLAGGA
jgi:hypothetical protein